MRIGNGLGVNAMEVTVTSGNKGDLGSPEEWSEQDRDDAFASPGPRFVQAMMRRIDPSVRIGAIRTALRDASVNARLVE
jgi:hypothetical protein